VIGGKVRWLLWLPVRIFLFLALYALLTQGVSEVHENPSAEGLPWELYAGLLIGLALIVLLVRRGFAAKKRDIGKEDRMNLKRWILIPTVLAGCWYLNHESSFNRADRCLAACPGPGLQDTTYSGCAMACEYKKVLRDTAPNCTLDRLLGYPCEDKMSPLMRAEFLRMAHEHGRSEPGLEETIKHYMSVQDD
jgi:hypothetical protein